MLCSFFPSLSLSRFRETNSNTFFSQQTKYNIDDYKRELKNSAFPPRNKTAGPINVNLSVEVKADVKKP